MQACGTFRLLLALVPVQSAALCVASGNEFEQGPILYSQSKPANRVSRLFEDSAAGERKLTYEENCGYLRSLLTELNVPVSNLRATLPPARPQRKPRLPTSAD